jgi:hypothetical protein
MRQGDDTGLDVPPRFATIGPQTFSANIALEGFGRSCLRNRHGRVNYLVRDPPRQHFGILAINSLALAAICFGV